MVDLREPRLVALILALLAWRSVVALLAVVLVESVVLLALLVVRSVVAFGVLALDALRSVAKLVVVLRSVVVVLVAVPVRSLVVPFGRLGESVVVLGVGLPVTVRNGRLLRRVVEIALMGVRVVKGAPAGRPPGGMRVKLTGRPCLTSP